MRLSRRTYALTAAALTFCLAADVLAQKKEPPAADPGGPGEKAETVKKPGAQPKSTAPKSKTNDPTPVVKKKKKPVNPKRVRVFLMDGSVIAGELSVEQITVTTEFGKLVVPVTKIVSITPGLDSHTKLSEKIQKLIDELGGTDYKAREAAQKELLAMGTPVRDLVAEHSDSKNIELARRAKEITGKLDELASGFDDFDDDTDKKRAWVKHDTVVTPDFTIAGRITPSVFQVSSKYGPLKVSLNDIKRTEKEFTEKEAIVKRLSVAGQKLILRGMQASRIRINVGDTITVSATGNITMPPWGSSARSGPDGNSRYGSSSQFANDSAGRRVSLYNGALVARIGSSGAYVKIGSRTRFKAKKAGVLHFGIAMNSSYSRSSSYFFGGEYKLRIKVDPKD